MITIKQHVKKDLLKYSYIINKTIHINLIFYWNDFYYNKSILLNNKNYYENI